MRRWADDGDPALERQRGDPGAAQSRRPASASSPTASGPSATSPTAPCRPGASAYVARTAGAEQLTRAVSAALAQESFVDPAVPPPGSRGKLTRRQREILQLLANGESTTVAARELGLSEETVKTHTKNVLARLGARNRTHAVAIALRECLIE